MSTLLEELALEGRLGKGHWRVLVYLWRRHLAGDGAVSLRSLGFSTLSERQHADHLAHRGLLVEAPEGGKYLLTAQARMAFGLPVDGALPATAVPDPRHAFLKRDHETQRLALAAWWDSGLRRDLAKQVGALWRDGKIGQAGREALDLAERWAAKLPCLFRDAPAA